MMMDNDEILVNYRQAKDPKGQIKILAELNGCSPEKIRDILRKGGEDIPAGKPEKAKRVYGYLDDELAKVFYKQGLSDAAIARELGCTGSAVQLWRKKNGLPSTHTPKRQPKEKPVDVIENAQTAKEPENIAEDLQKDVKEMKLGNLLKVLGQAVKLSDNVRIEGDTGAFQSIKMEILFDADGEITDALVKLQN